LTDLHIDIRRLSALAYPDTNHKTREVISCDYFIDALANPELGLKIRERQPKDLDTALHIALQLEVWHKDSERLQLALPKLIADNKKLRELTQQGGQSTWLTMASQGEVAQNNDDQHRMAVEQAKLMNDLRRTIDAIEAMKLHVHTDTPRPSPSPRGGKLQRRTKTSVNCYNCGQLGHIARNCPMSDGAIKKVEDNTCITDAATTGAATEGAQAATVKNTNASANNHNVDQYQWGCDFKVASEFAESACPPHKRQGSEDMSEGALPFI